MQEFNKAKQQFIGALEASAAEHRRARPGSLRPRDISGGPSEPAAHDRASTWPRRKARNLEEVKAFHAKYYGPAHMTLVVVGDVGGAGDAGEIAQGILRLDAAARITCVPRGRPRPSGRARNSGSARRQAERVGDLRSGDGLRYSDPDALRAARRYGDSRQRFHRTADGQRCATRKG